MVRVSICGKCMIFCNTDQAKLKVFFAQISYFPHPSSFTFDRKWGDIIVDKV